MSFCCRVGALRFGNVDDTAVQAERNETTLFSTEECLLSVCWAEIDGNVKRVLQTTLHDDGVVVIVRAKLT